MHGEDLESLQAHIPAEDLPSDYGGLLLEAHNYTADKLFNDLQ